MMTTFEIVQIIIGSGLCLGVLRLIFLAGKTTQKLDTMQKDISDLRSDLKETNKDIRSIDNRICRIEGTFNGPYHWEPRVIKKEDKNDS